MQHRKNLFSPASSTIVWAVLSLGAGACMLDRASTQADLLASTSSVGGATASSSGDFVASNSASSTSNTSSSSSSSSAGGAGGAPATWLTGFAQRKALTVPKEQVSGTLSNFVLPIVVTDPDLVNKAQADGDDIVFTTTDSTQQLDHELVRFDALTGELVLWLRAPSLASNQDNTFYMYYNNTEAIGSSTAMVWSDGYLGVWHLEEDPGPGTVGDVKDSSPVANHLTPHQDFEAKDSLPGRIGRAIDIDQTVDVYLETEKNLGVTGSQPFTLNMWLLPNDNPSDENNLGRSLFCWGPHSQTDSAFYIYYNSSESNFEWGFWANDAQTPGDYPQDQWYHLSQVYDGTDQRIYIDGKEAASRTVGSLTLQDTKARLGLDTFDQGRYLNALLDEVWLAKAARSADWIRTLEQSQREPANFVQFSPEEQAP